MKAFMENRLDPSLMSSADRNALDTISQMVSTEERPALIGKNGERIELPDQIFFHLVRIVRDMRAGKAIILFPENETLTTQAAADFLGVSRPYLVSLLDQGRITHHRVGSHRRVYLADLLTYMGQRDAERRKILDELSGDVESAGLYESGKDSNAG